MNLQEDFELQQLYELSKQQSSDLIFFDQEAQFFKNILTKYFLSKLRATNINRVQLLNSQLLQLHMVKANITDDLLAHQGNLQAKIKNLLSKSFDFLKLENNRIDDEIKDLNKCFKHIKKGIFSIYKDLGNDEFDNTGEQVKSNSINPLINT